AEALAESLVRTGTAMGKRIVSVITDMTEPLGNKVGNFLEVEESLDCLEDSGPDDLMEVTYRLGGWMLVAAGVARDVEQGIEACRKAIGSSRALELFMANVRSQGGDVDRLLALRGTYRSAHCLELRAPRSGYVTGIDAYKIGLAGVYLGVGRDTAADPVYPDVGFIFDKKVGAAVAVGDRICSVFGKDAASLAVARPLIDSALTYGPAKPPLRPLVLKEISAL
ncbi:MAG: thymidine phosphorylase, partial [Spirochaetaceae bacterium]|nr:thymidine phosphorylase [Spirochaetaceae bacterium]